VISLLTPILLKQQGEAKLLPLLLAVEMQVILSLMLQIVFFFLVAILLMSSVRRDSSSGLFANTTEGSTGDGGSIFIDPRNVIISDGAIISVNSQGTGIGGQTELIAGSLTLDEGTISAQTDSTTGGNISLNVQDLLLLRNGSQISTNAGTAGAGGDGGNILINAGAIVANSLENSDITANAFLGRGGNIAINTNSIFGIDFRQRLTPLSDITASSEAGLAGSVEINTSGIDPTRGLEGLTEERINVEVSQGCRVGASGEGKLAFFNLGRGGLPFSPDDTFNSPVSEEWISLESEENKDLPVSQRQFSSLFEQSNGVGGFAFSCQ
jgi:large exoprotein involved in heme utilization and adhesion